VLWTQDLGPLALLPVKNWRECAVAQVVEPLPSKIKALKIQIPFKPVMLATWEAEIRRISSRFEVNPGK
jgi:hypothetical protein